MLKTTRRGYIAGMIALLTVAACSGEMSTANPATGQPSMVYPITAEQADQVIAQSMVEVFPTTPIVAVALPKKGYMATISFAVDSHRITAVASPLNGRAPDGSIVSGYGFEVTNYGTIPITATARSKELFAALTRRAAAIRPPIPASN